MNTPQRRQRAITSLQRHGPNSLFRRLAGWAPGEAVLETIGRTSHLPRRTPVGGRLDGSTFWIVSEFGRRSNYVRNIEVQPRVRVQLRGGWHPGTAHLLDDDDPRRRLKDLPRLNSLAVRLLGNNLLTVRVDLDHPPQQRRGRGRRG